MSRSFWVETLGCPKNQVDSDKLTGTMLADGPGPGRRARGRRPGGGQHLRLHRGGPPGVDRRHPGPGRPQADRAELVVTGCMAERYGDELADALPEADAVAGFGVPVTLGPTRRARPPVPSFDLLNLPRPPARPRGPTSRWPRGATGPAGSAPSRRSGASSAAARPRRRGRRGRGAGRRRGARDRAGGPGPGAYGRDQGRGERRIVPLVEALTRRVDRVRLLYLYPSDLTDG